MFAELPEEVSSVRQAEDRAHRHGQRFPVNVYFLLARGTSDERRWPFLDPSFIISRVYGLGFNAWINMTMYQS